MNTGMFVLIGGVVGAGVLFYTSSGGNAARPIESPTPAAQQTQELAHSGKTPKASSTVSETPGPSATPTPPRLTLAQVFSLPRPAVPTAVANTGGGGPSWQPSTPQPTAVSASPTPTPTVTVPAPPSEAPSAPTPIAPTPTPTPYPYRDPWSIPTPPPLPPYPDAGLEPDPPSE